MTQIWK